MNRITLVVAGLNWAWIIVGGAAIAVELVWLVPPTIADLWSRHKASRVTSLIAQMRERLDSMEVRP